MQCNVKEPAAAAQTTSSPQLALMNELDDAIARGSPRRHADMLMHITDLFVRDATRYADDQIELFDDVLLRLAAPLESGAKSMLARRLAALAQAPRKITRMLASDDDINVAGPILSRSERLDEETLVRNARAKGEHHLLAIAQRKVLNEQVADLLVERGNSVVLRSIADNAGAKLSEAGLTLLIKRCHGDDALATIVGRRPDLPRHLFQDLLTNVSEFVRAKFAADNLPLQFEFSAAEPHFLFVGDGAPLLAA